MANVFFLGLKGDSISKEEGVMLTQVNAYTEKFETDKVTPQLLDLKFCLPCDLKDEVYSKPPVFRFIHTLRYDPSNRPKRKEPSGESCQCSQLGICDESCFNRIMSIECTGDASRVNGTKNPYWNCDVGTNCGNRALGLRQSVKCKPQREQGKGWGLITLEKVKKGSLVQEYVGEVIDDQMKNERLQIWSRDHPNDPNFYIMQLEAGWFIDARFEANLSRFINHSCDPNCVLRPVNVAGFTRNGIFAARDLEPGEFLSYDYQFDTRYGDKFQCRCGSKNCRGTMKGGKQQLIPDDDKKTLKQALAAAKNREEKDRKFLEEMQRLQEERFSQVDVMVPGAEYPSETVALGPHERHKNEAITQRILLWRNCRAGGNFWNRAKRLDQAKEFRRIKIDQSILTKESTIDLVTQLKVMEGVVEEQCTLEVEPTL